MTEKPPKIKVQDLRLSYGLKEVLHEVNFEIQANEIFGIIGPAQSGKTSLLRCINRTIEFTPGTHLSGLISVDGVDNRRVKDVYEFRRQI